jgi:hypothetical protein
MSDESDNFMQQKMTFLSGKKTTSMSETEQCGRRAIRKTNYTDLKSG